MRLFRATEFTTPASIGDVPVALRLAVAAARGPDGRNVYLLRELPGAVPAITLSHTPQPRQIRPVAHLAIAPEAAGSRVRVALSVSAGDWLVAAVFGAIALVGGGSYAGDLWARSPDGAAFAAGLAVPAALAGFFGLIFAILLVDADGRARALETFVRTALAPRAPGDRAA